MGDIGIGIKVGYRDVTAARKEMTGLKQNLEEVKESFDFSFGADKNAMDGATKGATKFKKELEGASSATAKVVRDFEKLIKIRTPSVLDMSRDGAGRTSISSGSAADYNNALTRSAERGLKLKRMTAAEQYEAIHGNKGRVVNGRGGEEEGGQGSGGPGLMNSVLGKIGGVVAGAAIIGTAMAFLHRARQKYEEGAINETTLSGRGMGNQGPYMGFGRTEMQSRGIDLNRQSGYTRSSTLQAAMKFSAATGTDPSLGIDVMASSRDLSKEGAETGKKMLGVLQAISVSTKDSPERINKLLSGGYGLFSKAQGGAELSGMQFANIQALTEALHKTGAQGRDSGTMGVLKDAFKSTGDPATDILKAKMLGVYDGPMTFDKVWDIKKRESQGLTSKENRGEFMKLMNDQSIPKAQRYTLASHFFKGMDPSGVETMLGDTLGKLDEETLNARMREFQAGKIGIDASKYKGAGVTVKGRQVKREERQHGWGALSSDVMGTAEDKLYDFSEAILGSGVPQKVAGVAKKSINVVANAVTGQGNDWTGTPVLGTIQDKVMVPFVNRVAAFFDAFSGMTDELMNFKKVLAEVNEINHPRNTSARAPAPSKQ